MRSNDDDNQARLGPFVRIGTIRTPFDTAQGTPIQGGLSGKEEGRVVIDPVYREGLSDLDGFSHLILIYAFHRIEKAKLKVIPYLDRKERGVFATRSPCRPNPIGMTIVQLLEINEGIMRVSGVDMLDETPLLDIKPSIPAFDYHTAVRCGWFEPHLKRIEEQQIVPLADSRFHD